MREQRVGAGGDVIATEIDYSEIPETGKPELAILRPRAECGGVATTFSYQRAQQCIDDGAGNLRRCGEPVATPARAWFALTGLVRTARAVALRSVLGCGASVATMTVPTILPHL
jgi:hypothetical protein